MSQHEGDGERTAPVIGLFGVEALVAKRTALQQRLGQASLRLNEANTDYNSCIHEIIEVNMALREHGVDTDAIGRELQKPAASSTAVEGYGSY